MRIGLFGHGKMGKMIEQLAQGHISPLSDCEVCIDFSHPSVVLEHVKWAAEHKKPIVIGTTGWEGDMPAARACIEKSQTAALFAPNFSLGVARFKKVLELAHRLLKEYEIAGVEYHHSLKLDSPSGTAKDLAHALQMKHPFASVRCGRFPGTHTVVFDSPSDTITLTHEAHSRESFAQGALTAARWIRDKKGWYTLDEMLRDLYSADYSV